MEVASLFFFKIVFFKQESEHKSEVRVVWIEDIREDNESNYMLRREIEKIFSNPFPLFYTCIRFSDLHIFQGLKCRLRLIFWLDTYAVDITRGDRNNT